MAQQLARIVEYLRVQEEVSESLAADIIEVKVEMTGEKMKVKEWRRKGERRTERWEKEKRDKF
ncbi:hypothetical protein CCMA1212_010532 [Trichoderma ghanense]|uniref:Uncharacterized protein n=1 Tax=Trichoderma ghanense TaxID=65468 RepID=A0ABY2GS43_9HYPO